MQSDAKVDSEALRNKISNKAKQTRNNLEDAHDYLSSITVLSDFSSSGKQKLINAKNQIKETNADIKDFKKNINEIADDSDETESKNESIINNIASSQAAYYEAQL